MRDNHLNELVDKVAALFAEKLLMHVEDRLKVIKQSETVPLTSVEKEVMESPLSNLGEVFLNAREMTRKLKISRVTLWRLKNSEAFPKARKVSSNRVVWLNSEVEQWMFTR